MARPRGDASDLLRRLRAAQEHIGERSRAVVSFEPMAEIVGMSPRNLLKTHIEPDTGFPVQKRGAEGVAWEFRVARVLKHMIKRAEERVEANRAAARKLQHLTSFTVPEDPEGPVSLADLSKLADLTMKAQAEKTRQGQYVPASKVRDFLISYNAAVTGGILGVSQVADPNGNLDPPVRVVVDNELRSVAAHVGAMVDKFLKEHGAGLQ